MKCIFCGSFDTTVSNSAMSEDGKIFRRRTCKDCGEKFYSVEMPADQQSIKEARTALWARK